MIKFQLDGGIWFWMRWPLGGLDGTEFVHYWMPLVEEAIT